MSAYWTPKAGTVVSDWEDGAAYDAASGWFAVTDGASSGASSREWAYTLASQFVADRPEATLGPDAAAAYCDWLDGVRAGFDPRSEEFPASRMPAWVQVAAARSGAHATFLGGRLGPDALDVVAVGDCCLFHLPADAERPVAFPVTAPDDFGSAPTLIRSLPGHDGRLVADLAVYHAPLGADDVVFAASDALAQWMVAHLGRPEVWAGLRDLSARGFGPLCEQLRDAGEMKNDDVTLWRAVPERRLAGRR